MMPLGREPRGPKESGLARQSFSEIGEWRGIIVRLLGVLVLEES